MLGSYWGRWPIVTLTLGASAAAAVPPEGPAFRCSAAKGEVEQLICADTALATLDRQLDQVYRAALAKATGPLAPQLRQAQRGWTKGRNECWKAKGQTTWITASWTVDTVRACVEAQYRLRISELQALWRLRPPSTRTYFCQGQAANELVVNAFDTDPRTLRIERGDQTRTLWQVGAPALGSFEGQNVSVTLQGDALKFSWLDTRSGQTDALHCVAR
ncbi:lysozyme inhibitor LprI family protein [Inhella sp.]|uniref:lysozyme inhibitor LprI family protein n=1 Tax=Inhella sp. TaxID=1921806 RepID=UPI0035B114B9